MATVHGRTRAQFYDGRADWAAARAVVSSVSIPVVVNGDCATAEDARAMLALSGAAGVMIGRAAVGAPWLVGGISRALDDGGDWREPRKRSAAKPRSSILIGWLANSGPAPDFAMRENIWRPTPIRPAPTRRFGVSW